MIVAVGCTLTVSTGSSDKIAVIIAVSDTVAVNNRCPDKVAGIIAVGDAVAHSAGGTDQRPPVIADGLIAVYLMRRLPSKWELHRRCIAGSAICAAVALAVAIILFWIFYASYLLFTPDEWLTGGQLGKLFMYWRVM